MFKMAGFKVSYGHKLLYSTVCNWLTYSFLLTCTCILHIFQGMQDVAKDKAKGLTPQKDENLEPLK